MDCNKDFWGEEYKNHTKCVSEQERYGGKVTVNKGEKKQEQWIDQIQQAVSKGALPPKISGIIQRLLSFDNIPRKQAKFKNFLRTSVNVRDEGLAEQVWKALESCTKQENTNNGASDPKPSTEKQEVQDEKEQAKELSKRERKEERKRAHNKKEKKDVRTQEEVKGEEPEKKSKKHKHREQIEDQTDVNTTETNEEELNSSEVAENGEPRKKKKKDKKQKVQNGNAKETKENELNESELIENGEPKKKNKKEKKLIEQNGSEELGVSLENDMDAEQNVPSRKDKKKKRKRVNENELNTSEVTNGSMDVDGSGTGEDLSGVQLNGKKQKKRKRELGHAVDTSAVTEESLDETATKKFRWDEVITLVLKKADDNELPLKKLRKKVMAEYNAYSSHQGHEDTQEKLWAKFEKKVKKNKHVKCHKERVKLVSRS
jgi:cell growth-regulating nucleolar protein